MDEPSAKDIYKSEIANKLDIKVRSIQENYEDKRLDSQAEELITEQKYADNFSDKVNVVISSHILSKSLMGE